jgi:hypothetical protein
VNQPANPWMRGRRDKDRPWGAWHLVTTQGRSVCGKFDATQQYRLERQEREPGRPCKNCITAAWFDLERSRILNCIRMARARP